MQDRNRNSKSNGNFSWRTGFAHVSRLPTAIRTVGLMVCLFLFGLSPTARAQGMASLIPASEYNALTNLFASTGGASWIDNKGWNDPTAATWTGVTVLNGHVAYIDLNDNQLTGTIPTTLNDLPYLQGLDLSQNQLSGSIPTNWDSLTNLQSLYLYQNNLTGRIPVGLVQLPLLYIDLSFNHLTGPILRDIGKWAQVQTINFDYNQLCGCIPCGVIQCTNLTYLFLGGNQLDGMLPWHIGNLNSLMNLDVGYNRLGGPIPTSIGALTNLIYLNMAGNRFTGAIPGSLGNLSQLQILYLNQNSLGGNIPNSLGIMPSLKLCLLGDNYLTGIVPDFTAFTGVNMDLTGNYFNVYTGSPSLANINAMIAAGNTVSYSPQDPSPLLGTPAYGLGSLRFTITGLDASYSILRSSDLKNWSNVGSVTVSNNFGFYSESAITWNSGGSYGYYYRSWNTNPP